MKILVITNQHKNNLNPSIYNLLNVVNILCSTSNECESCDVLAVGYNISNLATGIIKHVLVDKCIVIDDKPLENIIVDNIAPQISAIIKNYTHVLISHDDLGRNLAPRIAGILNIGLLSEVIDIISPNIYKRYAYAGNVLMELECLEDVKLLTIRTANFDTYMKNKDINQTHTQNIVNIPYNHANISSNIKYLSTECHHADTDLATANIIVSGGKSLLTKENFDNLIGGLANVLNAGVGATRDAVEFGIINNDAQIGQTGKIVSPHIYLGFGISGAMQHIAGMKNSKYVFAVNTDKNAPIFEYADYGLVADLFDIIPKLTTHFKKMKH